MPLADVEIGAALHKSLAKQGLEFHLETKVTGADVKAGKATVTGRDEGRQGRHASTATACSSPSAAGRTPRAWASTASA